MCVISLGRVIAAKVLSAAQSHIGQDEAALTAFLKPLDNVALWSALYHAQHAPFLEDDFDAFGWNQPGVRRACWNSVQALLRIHKGLSQFGFVEDLQLMFVLTRSFVRA